jgi:hypothetical protein
MSHATAFVIVPSTASPGYASPERYFECFLTFGSVESRLSTFPFSFFTIIITRTSSWGQERSGSAVSGGRTDKVATSPARSTCCGRLATSLC